MKKKKIDVETINSQLNKENLSCGPGLIPPAIKLEETEEVTEEAVTSTLRRGISFYSTIQAHDGHWPAETAGPLFFLPPLVSLFIFLVFIFIFLWL